MVPAVDPGLTFSLTYYSIDFTGQIAQPDAADPFDILAQESQWAAVITRNPTQAQIDAICNRPDFATLARDLPRQYACGDRRSAPGEFVVDASRAASMWMSARESTVRSGRFDFGLQGSYVFHFDQAVTNTSPSVDILNSFGNPLKLRFRATAGWNQHPAGDAGLGANLAVNFTNAYDNPGSALHAARRFADDGGSTAQLSTAG